MEIQNTISGMTIRLTAPRAFYFWKLSALSIMALCTSAGWSLVSAVAGPAMNGSHFACGRESHQIVTKWACMPLRERFVDDATTEEVNGTALQNVCELVAGWIVGGKFIYSPIKRIRLIGKDDVSRCWINTGASIDIRNLNQAIVSFRTGWERKNSPYTNTEYWPQGRIFSDIFGGTRNFDWLAGNDIRKFDVWFEPRTIGYSRSKPSVEQAGTNENEAYDANDRRGPRQYIEPPGYIDLPVPEAPLGGAVLFFGGIWLTSWGFRRRVLGFAHIAGWIGFVAGGAVLLLWGIPYIADMVSL
jgi:hypothetical protein